MAKNDKKKVQTAIDQQIPQVQRAIDTQSTRNQDQANQFQNNYTGAVGQGQADYGNMMGAYRNFLGNMPNTGTALGNFLGSNYQTGRGGGNGVFPPGTDRAGQPSDGSYGGYGGGSGGASNGPSQADLTRQYYGGITGGYDERALGPAIAGFTDFANTGGLSGADRSNIRARAIAPIRSLYSSGQREVQRAKALNPGLTNTGAAQAKLAREMGYTTSDAATNAEAMLANTIAQNRLAGLSGLAGIGGNTFGVGTNAMLGLRGQDLNAIMGSGNLNLGGLEGMNRLYGTTPGMANMFGQQMLQSGAQGIDLAQLRNSLASNAIGSQLNAARVPSNFQTGLGYTGQILGMGGQIAGAMSGMGGSGGYGPGILPSQQITPNFTSWMPGG